MFPQDYWYVLCEATELADKLFARTILNMPLVYECIFVSVC